VVCQKKLIGAGAGVDGSDPYLLTMFLLEESKRSGAEFVQAAGSKLDIEDGSVKAVRAIRPDGTTFTIPCDNIVIAAGPWTGPLSKTLQLPKQIPVTSYAGHSIIIRPSSATTLGADCLFMTLNTRGGGGNSYNPEIFPRTSGEIYICGVNENLSLSPTPVDAHPRSKDISKLKEIANTLFSEYTIEKEQLCFRPMTPHGEPFIGPVQGVKGVYIGAGHSFWGITLGPGTGKVLTEMILNEPLSADITSLAP
jgi:glycine/D-amino acid oxidase-like deaminating enzyme